MNQPLSLPHTSGPPCMPTADMPAATRAYYAPVLCMPECVGMARGPLSRPEGQCPRLAPSDRSERR